MLFFQVIDSLITWKDCQSFASFNEQFRLNWGLVTEKLSPRKSWNLLNKHINWVISFLFPMNFFHYSLQCIGKTQWTAWGSTNSESRNEFHVKLEVEKSVNIENAVEYFVRGLQTLFYIGFEKLEGVFSHGVVSN